MSAKEIKPEFEKKARQAVEAKRQRDHLSIFTIPMLLENLWKLGGTEAEIVAATGFARETVRKHQPNRKK